MDSPEHVESDGGPLERERDPSRLILLGLLTASLIPSGCTIVKPVVDAVAYPPVMVVERIDQASDLEPDDLPGPVILVAFPVLFPINYAYWTVHGAISGFFSGAVSDLNLITGHGTLERTWDTLLEPQKTNARLPE